MNDNAQMLRLVGQALIAVADTIQAQGAAALAQPALPPAALAQPALPPAAPVAPPPAAAAPVAPPPAAAAPVAPPPVHPAVAAVAALGGNQADQAAVAAFQAFMGRVRDAADGYKQATGQDPSAVVAVVMPRYAATKLSGIHPTMQAGFELELAYAFSNLPGYQQWLSQCVKPDGTVIPASEYPWAQG